MAGGRIEAMWSLVWRGMLTNDGMSALRAYGARATGSTAKNGRPAARRVHNQAGFRSRRTTPPTVQGRWAVQGNAFVTDADRAKRMTEWSLAEAHQLLARYGVVFRETAHAEGLVGSV